MVGGLRSSHSYLNSLLLAHEGISYSVELVAQNVISLVPSNIGERVLKAVRTQDPIGEGVVDREICQRGAASFV